MKRIPTVLTAAAAVALFGATTAPVAVATTAHPAAVSKQCTRGMTHKNGQQDCGKHMGGITGCRPNSGNTTAGGVKKAPAYKGNKKLPPCPPKTGKAPTPGHPNGHPAPGAGPGGQ